MLFVAHKETNKWPQKLIIVLLSVILSIFIFLSKEVISIREFLGLYKLTELCKNVCGPRKYHLAVCSLPTCSLKCVKCNNMLYVIGQHQDFESLVIKCCYV